MDQGDTQAQKVKLECQDMMDNPVTQENPDHQEESAHSDCRDLKAKKHVMLSIRSDDPGQKESADRKARLAIKETKAKTLRQELLEKPDHLEDQDCKDRPVLWVHREKKDSADDLAVTLNTAHVRIAAQGLRVLVALLLVAKDIQRHAFELAITENKFLRVFSLLEFFDKRLSTL